MTPIRQQMIEDMRSQDFSNFSFSSGVVPEASALMMLAPLCGLLAMRRRL